MENNLMMFNNEEFGEVRTIEVDGKVMFCGTDIARALGYKDTINAIKQHCRSVVKQSIPHPQSKTKTLEVNFINEGDLYRLVANSKLPSAIKFESWIFDTVLPTIRKTGGFVANDDMFIDHYLPTADERTRMLLKATLNTMKTQAEMIAEYRPKVAYADRMIKAEGNILIRDFAKLMSEGDYKIGEKKMFEWLRANRYLMANNKPYQKYVDNGVFLMKGAVVEVSGMDIHKHTTLVTPYGQRYLHDKIIAEKKVGE